jgi:hypothetical protein
VGNWYGVALAHRDPSTGERGPLYVTSGPTGFMTTTATAPGLQAINLSKLNSSALLSGIVIALYRTDTADLRIQRALDASGAPGTWVDLVTVRGSTETYTDYLPMGQQYWYRVTHDGASLADNFSPPIFATSQSVPPLLQPPGVPVVDPSKYPAILSVVVTGTVLDVLGDANTKSIIIERIA